MVDRLELQGRVSRIEAQQRIVLARKILYFSGQRVEAAPKAARRVMLQISRALPVRYSARASTAKASSLPAAASDSICASQTFASNSANQRRNSARSAGASVATAFSKDSTIVMIDHLLSIVTDLA